MESAGPRTRSRARAGDTGMPSSAAPSTRKKAAPRSTRKSVASKIPASPKPASAAHEEDLPFAMADVAEVSSSGDQASLSNAMLLAQHTDKAAPTEPVDAADSNNPSDVPDPANTAAPTQQPVASSTMPSGSNTISGLTPVLPEATMMTPGASPGTYGPSPVMPIKLDSLWTPQTAGNNNSSGFSPVVPAATAEKQPIGAASTDADAMDLASMFISTPAPAPTATPAAAISTASGAEAGSSSPIEGLFSAEAAPPAVDAAVDSPAAASLQEQQQQPSGPDAALTGSPAPAAAFAFAGVAAATDAGSPSIVRTRDAQMTPQEDGPTGAAPSAPPLPCSPHQLTPMSGAKKLVQSGMLPADTPLLPDDSPLPSASPVVPAGSPMLPEDSPLPADTPLPPDSPLLANSPLRLPAGSAVGAAGTPGMSSATPVAAAVDGNESAAEAVFAAGCNSSSSPAPVARAPSPCCGLPGYDDDDADMAADELCPEEECRALLQEAAAEVDMLAEVLQGSSSEASEQPSEAADVEVEQQSKDGDDAAMEAEVEQQLQELEAAAMDECCDSPQTTAAEPGAVPSAVKAITPAAVAAAAAASPSLHLHSGIASTTTAPPKSALARPRSGSNKHAHVVVPAEVPSPKTAPPAKAQSSRRPAMPGSAAAHMGFAAGGSGSSPGHTPYPTKAKIKAATAAAERGAATSTTAPPAAAAGPSKAPSHKKEMAMAAAHSALKHHSKTLAEAEAGPKAVTPPAAAATTGIRKSSPSLSPTIPNVSSRLLQPTASSMAKSRTSGASEGPDTLVWGPPSPTDAASPAAPAAAAGSHKPRLASKIVVPSPPAAAAAGPSLKALKRSIKQKVEERAAATLQDADAESHAAHVARVSKVSSGHSSKASKASRKAAAAAEKELDLDEEDEDDGAMGKHGDQETSDAADALAESLAGLSVEPLKLAPARGPLKGVAAPVGRHFVFDDAGNAQETPVSRQRRAPRHTRFDEDGNPIPAQHAAPRWR